jgi:hypothetical protein
MDNKLPPEWYSKIELFYYKNKAIVWMVVYFIVFFVVPFLFWESEPLDPQLLEGIGE